LVNIDEFLTLLKNHFTFKPITVSVSVEFEILPKSKISVLLYRLSFLLLTHPLDANCDKMKAADTNEAGPKQRQPLALQQQVEVSDRIMGEYLECNCEIFSFPA